MVDYVSVLNSVICLKGIRNINICYSCGTNYSNQYIHRLFVYYEDGKELVFTTTDREKAHHDYEGVKIALLGCVEKMDGKGEVNGKTDTEP